MNTTVTEQETMVTMSLTYTNAGRVLDAVWRQFNGDTASVNPDSRRNWEEIYHSIDAQMNAAATPESDQHAGAVEIAERAIKDLPGGGLTRYRESIARDVVRSLAASGHLAGADQVVISRETALWCDRAISLVRSGVQDPESKATWDKAGIDVAIAICEADGRANDAS